jgi:hypothetical protein
MSTPAVSKPLLVPTSQSCERPGSVERNMSIDFTRVRRTAAILFLGLSAFYLSLSPTSIAGQGYPVRK